MSSLESILSKLRILKTKSLAKLSYSTLPLKRYQLFSFKLPNKARYSFLSRLNILANKEFVLSLIFKVIILIFSLSKVSIPKIYASKTTFFTSPMILLMGVTSPVISFPNKILPSIFGFVSILSVSVFDF